MQQRPILIIALILYLFSVGVFLSFIGSTYGEGTGEYSSVDKDLNGNLFLNIATGVSILPVALNIILFIIPVGLLTYLIVVSLIPTIDAG